MRFSLQEYWSGLPLPSPTYLMTQMINNLPAMWETWVQSLGWEDPLEERMATHSVSCLEKPMDRGIWWASLVWRVAKSWIQLSD